MQTITNEIKTLGTIFTKHGFQIRVVGGCVRDYLMGIKPKDIDVCTNATPEQVTQICQKAGLKVIPTGIAHGTVTVIVDEVPIEITTLRIDSNCDGRHAEVAFTDDWEKDAERRDLTINAMSMDMDGKIYDFFNGQEHLKAGTIKFVGDANQRVREDFLRIMRYFRFAARIPNVQWDEDAIHAIETHKQHLISVSRERLWAEFSKILVSDNAETVLTQMFNMNIFRSMYGGVIGNSVNPTPEKIVRLAKLPKDVGMRLAVFMHPINSWTICQSMCVGSEVRDFVARVHSFKGNVKPKARLNVVEARRILASKSDEIEQNRDFLVKLALIHKLPRLSAELATIQVPEFPVKAQDLMAIGIKPSPVMGKILKSARDVWADSNFTASKDEILQEVTVRMLKNEN
jgi:tRNA nucleotidyltransferase/poly(A) polymerase